MITEFLWEYRILILIGVIGSLAALTVWRLIGFFQRFLVKYSVIPILPENREVSNRDRELAAKWIAQGVDPVFEQLGYHSEHLDEMATRLDTQKYPKLEKVEFDETLFEDLDRELGLNLKNWLENYNSMVENYHYHWQHLHGNLSEYFFEESDHEFRLANPIQNQKSAERCADIVLSLELLGSGRGWILDSMDTLQLLVPAVRKHPSFSEDFEDLEEIRESVLEESMCKTRVLRNVRDDAISNYTVTVSEIEEYKD